MSYRKEFNEKKRREEVDNLTKKLQEGIISYFDSERYKEYLSVMSRFHRYSLNNTLLIYLQCPDASAVASFKTWKKFGRQVRKGQKGIRILVPVPVRKHFEEIRTDDLTGETMYRPDGTPETESQEKMIRYFRIGHVFDLSQTEGNPLPSLGIDELTGDIENYERFFDAIRQVSPVPIRFDEIRSEAKGYYHSLEHEIVIREGMSTMQNVKTGIHEVAHAILHNRQQKRTDGVEKDRSTKECEAESVAFCVLSAFGIDTSEYSFPYVASWSSGKDVPELRASMQTIHDTAAKLIDDLYEILAPDLESVQNQPQGNVKNVNPRTVGNERKRSVLLEIRDFEHLAKEHVPNERKYEKEAVR